MFITASDNYQLYYDSHGSGPNLLLLHGFGDDHNTWYKTGWVDVLAPHFHVITPDIRGCGKSIQRDTPEIYSLEQHCKDIDALFAQFPHDENYLWGWSLGATLGFSYSKTRKFPRVICAGSYFGKIFTEEFVSHVMTLNNSPVAQARLRAFSEWPFVESHEMTRPFFVYTGTRDGNVVKVLESQEEEIIKAGGTLKVFPDCEHYDLLDKTELIKPFIFDFLDIQLQH
jgi:pimeloyl-ACP methyl ester carboxylesterase